MTRTLGLAVVFSLFATGAAFAVETPTSTGECVKLIESTEMAVEERNLEGEAANETMELLLTLDQQCNEADYDAAKVTAEQIEGMLGN